MTMTESRTGNAWLDAVVELAGSIKLHIGKVDKLADAMERTRRAIERPPAAPATFWLQKRATCGTGVLMLPLGHNQGPSQGRTWHVREIMISGNSVGSTPAGTGYVFVRPGLPQSNVDTLASIGSIGWRDSTVNAFPQPAFYGRGEITVRPGEILLVVISGGTQGTDYTAGCQIEEFEDAAGPQVYVQ